MKKNIVSLHGSYFGNNYGDILLVAIFAHWIKEKCPDAIINLPLADRKESKDLPEGTTGILKLIKSKCLVFCGGGYFGEQPKNKNKWAFRNFYRHGIVGLIAIIFRVPYAIIGVEFGPITSWWFRKICLFIAKRAKKVVVRNQESLVFLNTHGIKNCILSADAVLSLSELVTLFPEKNRKEILLHLPGISGHQETISLIMKSIVKQINSNNDLQSVGFITDSFPNIYNSVVYKDIFRILEESHIHYTIYQYKGYRDLINKINHSGYVITTKLHVGITAAALNVRPLSLYLHPKTKRLHNQINNSFCYPLNNLENIDSILCNYIEQSPAFKIPDEIKKMSLSNKTQLYSFLQSID
jgi:polysaccharide pyruvyl transferase WcaK-like protein